MGAAFIHVESCCCYIIVLRKIAILSCLQEVASQATRRLVLEEGYRVDGRGVTDVRPIWSRAGCLPRVHGSALFTRGETQALAVTTLGALHLAGRTSCPDLLRAFASALITRFVLTVYVTDVIGTQQRCIAAFSSSERGKPKRAPKRMVFLPFPCF